MSLGEKRNIMHSKAKGSIIMYMDDDDYYPTPIQCAVHTPMQNAVPKPQSASKSEPAFKLDPAFM